MALQSQGIVLRRVSTAAGSTVSITGGDIGFSAVATAITRQAGFADFATGMRVVANASLNTGVWTVSGGTGALSTAMTVHEPLTVQASGATMTIEGYTMQNIGQVVSFNGPAINANIIDVTNLASTAKEKLIGVYDSGQLALSVILDNEASNSNLHLELEADLAARTRRKFDIRFTDTGTSQPSFVFFEGYVQSWNITGSVDNALKGDIVIAIATGVNFKNAV